MTVTHQFRDPKALIPRALFMSLAVLFALEGLACSRPMTVPGESGVEQSDPHHATLQGNGTQPERPDVGESAAGESEGAADTPPFHDRDSLPAGTLISVRLKNPISAADLDARNPFEAVVIEPVILGGATLIPRGTAAAGLVESARNSEVKPNRGYVRLALASFRADGLEVPIQTASLFARRSPLTDASSSLIYLEKGRELTFRLTKPVYLSSQRPRSNH